jgi:hypothetical protein
MQLQPDIDHHPQQPIRKTIKVGEKLKNTLRGTTSAVLL